MPTTPQHTPTGVSPGKYARGAQAGWSGDAVEQGYGFDTSYMAGYEDGKAFRRDERQRQALGIPPSPLGAYLRTYEE